MNATSFLEELRGRGVVVAADGDQVVCRDPGGTITGAVAATIREHKPALLRLLEEERFREYGLGRCRQCRRVMELRHLRPVGRESGLYDCLDLAGCVEFRQSLRLRKEGKQE